MEKLTPKQRVLKKWPNAQCLPGEGFYVGMWVVRDPGAYPRVNVYGNHTTSQKRAWTEAARNLR